MPQDPAPAKLSAKFNEASKVVKLTDLRTLMSAYGEIEGLGYFNRLFAENVAGSEMKALWKKDGGKGFFVDDKKTYYVDSQFVKNGVADLLKDPKLTTDQRKVIERVNTLVGEALDGCRDYGDNVKNGKIKALGMKPK